MNNGSHSRHTGRYFDGPVEKMEGRSSASRQVSKKMHKKKQRQYSKKLTEDADDRDV